MKTIRVSRIAGTLVFAGVSALAQAQGGSAAAAVTTSAAPSTAPSTAASSVVTDKQLASSVRTALRNAKRDGLKSTFIRVKAKNGVVTLSGVVEDANQIALATKVAQGVAGVTTVTNKLDVRGPDGIKGTQ